MSAPAIRIAHVDKSFGPVRANRDASLAVARGEIHALVGENGAGKSTLMRILSGMFAPDAGTVEVADASGARRDVTGWDTAEAIAAGVGMVHQHFMLVPTLTVAENVILGREPTRGLVLDRARAEREVRELSERTGLRVDPARLVAELSVGEAQRVEILKVLYRGARILILDEPTAVLSPPEVLELWKVLRALKADGGTIILITHKLDEVIEISEAITVMRAGTTVGRMPTAGATPRSIARMMVGRDVALALDATTPGENGTESSGKGEAGVGPTSEERPEETASSSETAAGPATPERPGAVGGTRSRDSVPGLAAALAIRDLVVAGPTRACAVDHVSLTVAPGEILGLAGVEGNGQTELIDAITGLRPVVSGSIRIWARRGFARADTNGRSDDAGDLIDITHDPVRARSIAGLSHIPEDRHRRGLILDYSIADNLILGQQHRFSSGGRIDVHRVAENADAKIREFDIRPADPALSARALSGGNQQKIVIAREMGRDFAVLVAAQPTRGVDVGAIEFIHDQLRRARDSGKAILLLSADLIEILALADRVAVMYGGRIVVELPRAVASPETLGPYMTGAVAESAA